MLRGALWLRAVGINAINSLVVTTGNNRVLWIFPELGRDAEDECGVGAKLVAEVVNVPCSAVLVVPICVPLCEKVPCGEAQGDGDGAEG